VKLQPLSAQFLHVVIHDVRAATAHQSPAEERVGVAVEGALLFHSTRRRHSPSLTESSLQYLAFKFLNTFIDDLFAFIIKMPTMHRISVFRDDIIFIIYMYQRWIYRIDESRPVEK
jgi:hypothetical protein